MTEIMTEISLYLIIAIFLGYIFGWLVTKAMMKDRLEKYSSKIDSKEINRLNEEITECNSSKSALSSENNKILLENREQKLKLHKILKQLKERDLLVKNKNNSIAVLNNRLEEREKLLQQKIAEHESEINAFIEERTKIIEKFKSLQP